jgi:hypothetical protein
MFLEVLITVVKSDRGVSFCLNRVSFGKVGADDMSVFHQHIHLPGKLGQFLRSDRVVHEGCERPGHLFSRQAQKKEMDPADNQKEDSQDDVDVPSQHGALPPQPYQMPFSIREFDSFTGLKHRAGLGYCQGDEAVTRIDRFGTKE